MKKLFVFLFIFISHSSFAEMMCDVFVSDYFAVYEANTYTCNVGQYLPANTLGCVPCPSGLTCPGGTFDFNPDIFQGLDFISVPNNTLNNMCADNFPSDLYAIYEPNIITLNWNDGTNITTTQCAFGETITIPAPPTRPGYKFGGWRVKRRN